MSLPNRLRSARLTNATQGSTIDDEIGNLEKALCDILGITIDVDVTAALLAPNMAGGLQFIQLANAAANPTVAGQLMRNNTRLLWHNTERAVELQPAGEIKLFFGTSAPAGWLLCDGTAYSRTTYARLFATIGILGGPGDGTTTFNVPDWRKRVPVGLDAGGDTDFDTIGKTGGSKTAAHTHTHSHTHTQQGVFTSDDASAFSGLVAGGGLPAVVHHTHNLGIFGQTTDADVGVTNSTSPSVVQPYGVCAYYIST